MELLAILGSPWFFEPLLALFAVWTVLSMSFRQSKYFKGKPMACAHEIVVLFPFVYLAVTGTKMWFFDKELASALKDDADQKVFFDYQPGALLVQTMLAFQIWDFCSTIILTKELKNQGQHLAHHASATVLCVLALKYDFLYCYGPFFFGVTELSSVPLALMNLFKYSKELTDALPTIAENVRVIFAVVFLLIRCIYWPIVAVDFWEATLASTAPLWLRLVWWIANIGLTLLQYFWGSLIVKGIIKLLKGESPEEVRAVDDGPLLDDK